MLALAVADLGERQRVVVEVGVAKLVLDDRETLVLVELRQFERRRPRQAARRAATSSQVSR